MRYKFWIFSSTYSLTLSNLSLLYKYNWFHLDCYVPEIEFDTHESTVLKPLNFLYNENIYIDSKITFNCTHPVSITTVWTIITCSPICSQSIPITFSLESSQNQLFIPAYSLFNGIYELKFTVTIIDVSPLFSSSSIYIKIIRPNIITNLLSFTAINITQSYQQELILNPGKYSIDLNAIIFNTSVSCWSKRRNWIRI
jgi:hypothetical protein